MPSHPSLSQGSEHTPGAESLGSLQKDVTDEWSVWYISAGGMRCSRFSVELNHFSLPRPQASPDFTLTIIHEFTKAEQNS